MHPRKIGITTTVPVEILLAAGLQPVDLNNLFITAPDPAALIAAAESDGFPKSLCAWIKGIYGALADSGIQEVVGVLEGDCSNTRSLTDILSRRGVTVHRFAYPHCGTDKAVGRELAGLMDCFGVSPEAAEAVRWSLLPLREKLKELDRLTWQEGRVTGFENHLWQVSASDFNGDPVRFEEQLDQALEGYRSCTALPPALPLGYVGVPPMTGDLYAFVETKGFRVVYNEVQREFAFPRAAKARDLKAQYTDFTYPYALNGRIAEIRSQIERRGLRGILHYSQTFCHRAMEDIILSRELGVPVLNITADRETALDARTKLRLEAFLEMLQDQERGIFL